MTVLSIAVDPDEKLILSGDTGNMTRPLPPRRVRATPLAAGEVLVQWAPPLSPGRSVMTSQTIIARRDGQADVEFLQSPTAKVGVCAGLIEGATYTFLVTATNTIGVSAESRPSDSVTVLPVAEAAPAGTTLIHGESGISWLLSGDNLTHGVYANGYPWVVGPVTVIAMSPAHITGRHGWQPNPEPFFPTNMTAAQATADPAYGQPFDSRVVSAAAKSWNPALQPALPYTAAPGTSVVKTASNEPDLPTKPKTQIRAASVLTVLAEAPAGNGAGLLRPPYSGTVKTHTAVADIDLTVLPSLTPPTSDVPTLESLAAQIGRFQMMHMTGGSFQSITPTESAPTYPADTSVRIQRAILRLCLNDTQADKLPLATALVQWGLDCWRWYDRGMLTLAKGDGANPGLWKLCMGFTALLLNQPTRIAELAAVYDGDDHMLYRNVNGVVVWGAAAYDPRVDTTIPSFAAEERAYWGVLARIGGDKFQRDPYGLIDGGTKPGTEYHTCCTSPIFKGVALILRALPALQAAWADPTLMLEYADRWVTAGVLTQPDDAAPFDGVTHLDDTGKKQLTNYGIAYGPDGNGSYIKGAGRFPQQHGTAIDSINQTTGKMLERRDPFVASMWATHRAGL